MLKWAAGLEDVNKMLCSKCIILDKYLYVLTYLCTHVWMNVLPELFPHTRKLVCSNVQPKHVRHCESIDLRFRQINFIRTIMIDLRIRRLAHRPDSLRMM